MKKIAIILIVLTLICVGFLSGCTQQSTTQDNEDESILTKTYATTDALYEEMLPLSVGYRKTVTSIAERFKLEDDMINYDHSQFIADKGQLNSHDLTTYDRYGKYERSRTELIQGLEYITNEEYENAWSQIIRADREVGYMSMYSGYYVTQDFGLEELSHFCYSIFKK